MIKKFKVWDAHGKIHEEINHISHQRMGFMSYEHSTIEFPRA